MEERIARVEARVVRLVQALVPLEADLKELKLEVKSFKAFKDRLEGQIDLVKWLIVTVPTLSTIATAIVTYVLVHKG